MLIQLKNKDTLHFDNFLFKCAIGKKGISSKKKEGDFSTPKGIFSIKYLYYRHDRITKPETKIIVKKITKNYKPTAGCIALKKKDLLILLKIINKKTKIKIN